MAFVLLPCDLPTWPTICRHLQSLRGVDCPKQVTQTLLNLHSLCNVSIEPDPDDFVPKDFFAGVERFLTHEAGPDFYTVTLPALLDAAFALKERKPQDGITYSLQQQNDESVLARPLVASLLAHIFFCTMPRRGSISHPTLTDPCIAPVLSSMHSDNIDDMKSQRVKIQAFLHYFTLLAQQPLDGYITYSRKVMGSKQFVTLGQWQDCEWPLCPVVIQHEGRIESAVKPCLLATFSSADVARPALSRHNSQQVCTMLSYPELIVSAVFTERLEDNEVMQVTGALHTATVQDLKTKPSFIPRYTDTNPGNVIHALMDADDYKQSDVLQYEQINVLRELNKAFLAFTQPIPIGLVSPAVSDFTSVSRQNSHGSTSPATQYKTQVSSNEHSEDQLSKEENDKQTNKNHISEEQNSNIKEVTKCLGKNCLENKKAIFSSEKINKNNNIICDRKEVVNDYLEDKNIYNSDMSSCSCNNIYNSQVINEEELKETTNINDTSSIKVNNNANVITIINSDDDNENFKEDQKRKEQMSMSKICDRNNALGIILENIQMPQPERENPLGNDILVDQKSRENKNSDNGNVISVANGTSDNIPLIVAGIINKETSIVCSNTIADTIEHDENKVGSDVSIDKDVPAQETESGFVTAPTTLKRPRKRNRKKRKGNKQIHASNDISKGLPLVIIDQSQIANQEHKKINDNSSETLPDENLHIDEKVDGISTHNDETSRLLNKVLRAIQKLEEERPELLEEAVQEEQQKQQQPEIINRGKPPLPETKNKMSGQFSKSSETRVEVVPSVEQFLRQSQHREGTSRDGRKLSIYQICPEECPVQSSLEDPYYSACESLENQDVARPHRRRGSKKNNKKIRRKQSFADRLKETLARGDSIDEKCSESLLCLESDQELDNRLSRHDSSDIHLGEEEAPLRPVGLCLRKESLKAHFQTNSEEQDLDDLELRGLSGSDEDDNDDDDDDDEFSDEYGDDRGDDYDRNESDESRYSFSSDYTSDLEEVYDQLGQVLDDNEGSILAPRQAAVARFAHGLFKRALSESYKGVTLRLDGSTISGQSTSEAALPPRSKSLNEPADDVQHSMTKHNGSVRLPPQLWEDRRRAVVTGNWGCGSLKGDHQLKAMIQWCAASRAGAPRMIYYTCGDQNTVKLDIVCRLLSDRGWRVGELVATLLQYCNQRLEAWKTARKHGLTNHVNHMSKSYRCNGCSPMDSLSLFDELIGADRPYVHLETEL